MSQTKSSLAMPGPRGYPILGVLPNLMTDPLTFYKNLAPQYGDIVEYRIGPIRMYAVTGPDYVRHVLLDNYRNYPKGAMWDVVRHVFGNGLAVSEGDFWLRQRRLIQPAFHRERIAGLVTLMTDVITQKMVQWQAVADGGQPLEMAAEMAELTLQVVLNTLFSTSISRDDFMVLNKALTTALQVMNQRFWIFFLPDWLPKPGSEPMEKAVMTLDKLVNRVIDERRTAQNPTHDLMTMLMAVEYEDTHESMSNQQLRDEILTMFTAGHETTANSMTWVWYLIAQYPEIEARLQAEIDTVLGDERPTLAHVPQLQYSKRVIQETMRLYPAVWNMPRAVAEEDTVNGHTLKAGSMLMINTYGLHRHPDIWEEPERFNPDRFVQDPPRFAYIPFGGGPHVCIGNEFAMMEAQLILAQVMQRFRPRLVSTSPVELKGGATLYPKHGIQMMLERRES